VLPCGVVPVGGLRLTASDSLGFGERLGLQELNAAKRMLTICTTAKPFRGHIALIQRNAMISWTKLEPRPEIILFGTEEGTSEMARDMALTHVADVARNRYGTPLLADILASAEKHGSGDVFAYVNADIILTKRFTEGLEKVSERFGKFLAVGRRTNLDVTEALDFREGWEEKLSERMRREGQLESHTGMDFFAFSRGEYENVPPLAIGRVWFDQWLVKYARKKGIPVVDLTEFTPIAHQLHDYNHVSGGRELGTYGGAEADENFRYYGEKPHAYTILSATHVMTKAGRIRRVLLRREMHAVATFLWDVFVNKTSRVRKRLGLTRAGA